MTGYNRKHVIHLLGGNLQRQRAEGRARDGRTGRRWIDALRVIHETLDYICAERLTPNLVWMAEQLARHGELDGGRSAAATAGADQRLDGGAAAEAAETGRATTATAEPARREKAILRGIPMVRLAWDYAKAGTLRGRPGASLWPVSLGISICVRCSGSTLPPAGANGAPCWGAATAGDGGCVSLHPGPTCPFQCSASTRTTTVPSSTTICCASGAKLVPGVTLSRSRPYHKNDNPRVEQKNRTLIRDYLGDYDASTPSPTSWPPTDSTTTCGSTTTSSSP